ncbi:hypothetical protein ADUPG1_012375 [Aduncisulcus paluster]|uniref:CCZ1/INTU/HSP4 first Longin domain-containing protein n=1 Tax=Aduncisulcus paluster TaxID=2918883 RepID=A0ABQ5JZ94_9EUKA|nr:hypothetical protein ADUPG1_012375 [Aduncisulcus paluster]
MISTLEIILADKEGRVLYSSGASDALRCFSTEKLLSSMNPPLESGNFHYVTLNVPKGCIVIASRMLSEDDSGSANDSLRFLFGVEWVDRYKIDRHSQEYMHSACSNIAQNSVETVLSIARDMAVFEAISSLSDDYSDEYEEDIIKKAYCVKYFIDGLVNGQFLDESVGERELCASTILSSPNRLISALPTPLFPKDISSALDEYLRNMMREYPEIGQTVTDCILMSTESVLASCGELSNQEHTCLGVLGMCLCDGMTVGSVPSSGFGVSPLPMLPIHEASSVHPKRSIGYADVFVRDAQRQIIFTRVPSTSTSKLILVLVVEGQTKWEGATGTTHSSSSVVLGKGSLAKVTELSEEDDDFEEIHRISATMGISEDMGEVKKEIVAEIQAFDTFISSNYSSLLPIPPSSILPHLPGTTPLYFMIYDSKNRQFYYSSDPHAAQSVYVKYRSALAALFGHMVEHSLVGTYSESFERRDEIILVSYCDKERYIGAIYQDTLTKPDIRPFFIASHSVEYLETHTQIFK